MPCLVNSTSTTSKRSIWPEETRDSWVSMATGSEVFLSPNGKWYDDWASALGANTLGYGKYNEGHYDPQFNPATSLPWQIEHDFANSFCAAMETDAVRFAKNGSDATNMAVRLARGFTGRDNIIVFDKSYHGTGSEFKPIAWNKAGYPDTPALALPFGEELRSGLIGMGRVAAVVVEPVPKAIDIPPAGWLEHLREVCDEHGILLVADQVILGYRHSLTGYPGDDSVRYDLLCFGKAMGQGAALSACTGRASIMNLLKQEVHYSGTNFGEPLPLQIAQWTLREYLEEDVCAILNDKGRFLKHVLDEACFITQGLNSRFEVIFDSPEAKMDCTRFCFEHGVLFSGFCSMAVSHTAEQCVKLVDTLKKWRDK